MSWGGSLPLGGAPAAEEAREAAQIGGTLEEWYGADAVYSYDAPGVWESTERATRAPSSLHAVWGAPDAALPSLPAAQPQPLPALAAASASAADPAAATPAPAPRAAAWGKLSADLRASAAAVPPEAMAALLSTLAAGGGGGAGEGGEGSSGAHPMRPSAAAQAAALSSALAAAAASAGLGGGAFAPPPPPQRPQDRPGNTPCSFFLTGLCRFGDSCKFRHVKPEPWAVEYFENLLLDKLEQCAAEGAEAGGGAEGGAAPAAAAAAAAEAEACLSESDFAASSRTWLSASLESQQAVLAEAVAAGVASDLDAAEIALGAAERGISRSIECSVCLENVTDAVGRRFGLLTGCAHAFCLECIREWRARIDLPASTVRACPLCRRLSYYVIPSDRYIADEGRKARLNAEYHAAQRALPCRNFDQGRGVCPFGTSCFYAHLLPNGQPAPVAKHTFLVNSDGEIRGVGKKPSLADFLFNK